MLVHISFTAAVIPALLLMLYFHRRDVNREPARVVWFTFILGVVSTAPVVGLVLGAEWLGLDPDRIADPRLAGLASAFFQAAIPEELFKYLVLMLFVYRHREFDEPMDGVVYGVAASLGFAAMENVLYVFNGGMVVALLRAVTAVPGHAFLGVVMGYYVGQIKFNKQASRFRLILFSLLWPIILHGLYDFPLLSLLNMEEGSRTAGDIALILLTLAVLILEGVWALLLVRKLRRQQLNPEAIPTAKVIPAPRPANPVTTWLQIIVGGLLLTWGGVLTALVALGTLVEQPTGIDILYLILGVVILALLPMTLGLFLFIRGLKRIPPRVRRARTNY